MTPTPEQLALAASIAAQLVPHQDAEHPEKITRLLMWDTARQSALAAIIETSERAAMLADWMTGVGLPRRSSTGDALRSGEHLKGDGRP